MRLPTKEELKDRFATVLMVAPTLSVVLMSAILSLASGMMGIRDGAFTVFLGILSILSLVASAVLSYVWDKRMPVALLAVVLWLCFFCYLAVVLSGTSDLLEDAFFQAITLVFTLPAFAYSSVVGGSSVGALILTAILATMHTGVLIAVGVRRRKASQNKKKVKKRG